MLDSARSLRNQWEEEVPMQKKIFMPKGSQAKSGDSRTTLKWLFLAAVALVVLVIVTTHMMAQRKSGTKEAARIAAEKGAVVKEIPRTLELMQDKPPQTTALNEAMPANEVQGTPEESSPAPVGQPPETSVASSEGAAPPAPASAKPDANKGAEPPSAGVAAPPKGQEWVDIPQPKPSSVTPSVPAEKPQMAAVKETGAAPPAAPPRSSANEGMSVERGTKEAKGSKVSKLGPVGKEGEPKTALAPVSKASPQKPTQVASIESPEAAKVFSKNPPAGGTPTAAKTAPPTESAKPQATGPGTYLVQVGSFKDKQNADEMQKALQKKGYNVTVRTTSHSKLGQLYVVQLQPVDNAGKASTLVEQIKHEEKVKPIIVRTGAGE